jgi:hypothetical protein
MSGGGAVIFAAPFVLLGIVLIYLLRRERLRGPASTTHPFLVGLYRGLAFLLFLFAMWLLVGAFVLPRPRELQTCSSGASYLPDGSYVCVRKVGGEEGP